MSGATLSFWIFLWILISVVLIGFSIWTYVILFRQRKVWKSFAAKNKFEYNVDGLFAPPAMEGNVNGYDISFFAAEHQHPEARSGQKRTACEVMLKSQLLFEGAIASNFFTDLVKTQQFEESWTPDHEDWNKKVYFAQLNEIKHAKQYFDDHRLTSILGLFRIKNSDGIFIVREGKALLRIDLSNPLLTEEKLEKLMNRVLKCAEALELADEEKQALMESKAIDQSKMNKIEPSEVADNSTSFEFEDDE